MIPRYNYQLNGSKKNSSKTARARWAIDFEGTQNEWGQRYAVHTYFPWHCERFVVLLAVEKAFDIADELEFHLIVEDHIVPLATLDVLPKLVILPPIPSIINPYLFLDLRQMLSGGRDKLVHRLGPAIYDILLASWI